jgi:hypothetical protein
MIRKNAHKPWLTIVRLESFHVHPASIIYFLNGVYVSANSVVLGFLAACLCAALAL